MVVWGIFDRGFVWGRVTRADATEPPTVSLESGRTQLVPAAYETNHQPPGRRPSPIATHRDSLHSYPARLDHSHFSGHDAAGVLPDPACPRLYLVQYQKDAIIRYTAFPEYWGGKAKIDDLIFAITPDASVRWAKLQKGECQIMPYPNPADLAVMRKDPKITVLEQPGLNVGYLAYNTTKKPFDDVRVRKAVNMAIDKQAIVDSVYLGSAIGAKNPIPPSMWSYNNAIKDDPFDPAAAKKLLAAAGFADGFSTDLWAMPVQRPYNPNAKRIAELMQADLAKIGIKAEIKSFEWGEYRKRMQAGEHQMGMLGWTGDNGDPDNFLHTLLGCDAANSGGSNVAKFCFKPFEELVQKAKVTTNVAERTKLYEQAQVVFKEQAPWFTIAHAVQLKPMRKEGIDFKLSPFGRHSFHGVDIKE